MQGLLISLIIGGVAGWLAGLVVKGNGNGLLMNIIVGVLGGAIAGWLFPTLGINIGGATVGAIINATVGAILLLVVLNLVRRG